MTTSDFAAPNVEPMAPLPRYNPMRSLPIENNSEVTAPPTHTSFHFIVAAGTNLNMHANITVIPTNDTAKSRTLTMPEKMGNSVLT